MSICVIFRVVFLKGSKTKNLKTAALLSTALYFASAAGAQELTAKDRDRAVRLLDSSRAQVDESVRGLSEAQWTFKPGPDRWSVAEIVEHMALIEGIVKDFLVKIDQAPPPPADRNAAGIDEMILTKVPDRSTKVKAPEIAVPNGRWTPSVALEQFRNLDGELAEIVRTASGLRQHAIPHPILGPLDGYQWILTVGAHNERHNQQILEVKADPHFPEK